MYAIYEFMVFFIIFFTIPSSLNANTVLPLARLGDSHWEMKEKEQYLDEKTTVIYCTYPLKLSMTACFR